MVKMTKSLAEYRIELLQAKRKKRSILFRYKKRKIDKEIKYLKDKFKIK